MRGGSSSCLGRQPQQPLQRAVQQPLAESLGGDAPGFDLLFAPIQRGLVPAIRHGDFDTGEADRAGNRDRRSSLYAASSAGRHRRPRNQNISRRAQHVDFSDWRAPWLWESGVRSLFRPLVKFFERRELRLNFPIGVLHRYKFRSSAASFQCGPLAVRWRLWRNNAGRWLAMTRPALKPPQRRLWRACLESAGVEKSSIRSGGIAPFRLGGQSTVFFVNRSQEIQLKLFGRAPQKTAPKRHVVDSRRVPDRFLRNRQRFTD